MSNESDETVWGRISYQAAYRLGYGYDISQYVRDCEIACCSGPGPIRPAAELEEEGAVFIPAVGGQGRCMDCDMPVYKGRWALPNGERSIEIRTCSPDCLANREG